MSSGFRKSTSFLLTGFPDFDLCFLKEFVLPPKQHIYNFVPFSKTLINTFPSFPMGSGLDPCLLQLTSRQAPGFNSAGPLTATPTVLNVFLFSFLWLMSQMPCPSLCLFRSYSSVKIGLIAHLFLWTLYLPWVENSVRLFSLLNSLKCTSCAIHLHCSCCIHLSNIIARLTPWLWYCLTFLFVPCGLQQLLVNILVIYLPKLSHSLTLSFPLLMTE